MVVRRLYDGRTISHMNENRRKFLNMTKNCQDIVRLVPDDCDVVQRRARSHDLPPIVRDHPKITHRRWS